MADETSNDGSTDDASRAAARKGGTANGANGRADGGMLFSRRHSGATHHLANQHRCDQTAD
ncbi:MAG: hypothetical protein A2286_12135 [Gammaproteobacteria bacterium RIFOXYA12_FULL_61_12]|nr:MAG: hypothetical protein A2286_12135 [Gammaproteobacteria bacterium RIFOXYA12_FULL_61_12]